MNCGTQAESLLVSHKASDYPWFFHAHSLGEYQYINISILIHIYIINKYIYIHICIQIIYIYIHKLLYAYVIPKDHTSNYPPE